MAKYIDADLLRKEIEKERKSIDGLFIEGDNSFYDGQDDAYNHTLAFIDSLQQEQSSESLEEAAEEKYPIYWKNYPKDGVVRSESAYDTNKQCRDAFIVGAEWQKKRFEAEYELDWLTGLKKDLYELGRKDEREQMMKEAVEGEVIKTDKHTSVRYKAFYGTDRYFYGIADKQFKPGDKVRIIIVKEENK